MVEFGWSLHVNTGEQVLIPDLCSPDFLPLFGALTLFTPLFPSCSNHSIDLNCKPMDWFLHEENIGMEKINKITLPGYHNFLFQKYFLVHLQYVVV